MTSSRPTPLVPGATAADAQSPSWPARLGRLLTTAFLGNASLFAIYIGVGTVLIPNQVAAIDPDPARKALNLGLVAGAAALVAAFAQPVFGSLSDKSGRRNPWILAGAVAMAAVLFFFAGFNTVVLLAVGWCVLQIAGNTYQVAMSAVIPDRVPLSRRGLASAVYGAATPIAAVVGVVVATRFAANPRSGYLAFGIAIVIAAVLFVTLNREKRLPVTESAALTQQWRRIVSALAHRDFRLAFLARAAVFFAYNITFGFTLYILEERVQLPRGLSAANAYPIVLSLSAAAMVVGLLLGGILADRLRQYRAFVILAAALMVIGALFALLSPSFGAIVVFGAVQGLGFGCFLAVDMAIVTLVLPHPDDAARDLGVLNVASAAPQTVAAFVAGTVVAAFGGGAAAYGNLFIISIVFAVLGGIAIWGVKGVR